MKRVVLPEHGRLVRWRRNRPPPAPEPDRVHLEDRLFRRLERFERGWQGRGEPVFSWSADGAQARQWVGVVQIPGLHVEILPKIDARHGSDGSSFEGAAEGAHEARRNLVYMLSVAGDVPVRARDAARLSSRRAPLGETLSAVFAEALLTELLRGTERGYVSEDENLRTFRGRLLVSRHAGRNAAHRERFLCRYDEFSLDTVMNRVFKAACRWLLESARTPATRASLMRSLLLLEEVTDEPITPAHFERVTFNRQNERFSEVFRFCRLVLEGRSPTAHPGGTQSFSLLFDMNRVFERFVAGFVRQQVLPRFEGVRLFPQAQTRTRHLMRSEGRGTLPLRPDLLFEGADGGRFVVDTKWKVPPGGAQGRMAPEDLYQLHAYTRRFGCARSALLYPSVPGARSADYDVLAADGAGSGEVVGLRLLDLRRDLRSSVERGALADALAELVSWGLGKDAPTAVSESAA